MPGPQYRRRHGFAPWLSYVLQSCHAPQRLYPCHALTYRFSCVVQVGEMLTSARNPGGRGLLVTALKSRSAPVVRALLEWSAFSLAQVHSLLIVTVN